MPQSEVTSFLSCRSFLGLVFDFPLSFNCVV